MTLWAVADSSIYLAIALREPHADAARALIGEWTQTQTHIAAPYLFRYELISVVRKHITRGNITLSDGQAAINGLLRRPVEIFTEESLLHRAFKLASDFNFPAAYDSVYLALAEQLGCEFWTADLKLVNLVSIRFSWVKWIGNFALPETNPTTR